MTMLCDLISNDLNNIWYSYPDFEHSKEKYRDEVINKKLEPIKIEIAELLHEKSDINESYTRELEILEQITYKSVSGLITTNYDQLLEGIFQFKTYNSQDELLFNVNYEVGEIYKIHGSITDPSTIMITSKDYQKIDEKNKYIAAKLMTLFIEHPIIFIGYSISDEDIRNILYSITQCLEDEQKELLQKRLIFIEWDKDIDGYKEASLNITFPSNENITLTKFIVEDFEVLFKTVANNKAEIPIKTLRKLKQAMYQLTLSTEASEKIKVYNPDEIIANDNFEIFAGFGLIELAKRGYSSISKEEIYEDIVKNNKQFNIDLIVTETLPIALMTSGNYLPFRKYLSEFKGEIPDIVQRNIDRFKDIEDFIPKFLKENTNFRRLNFDEAMQLEKPKKVYEKLALVNYDSEDNREKLNDFLSEQIEVDTYNDSIGLRRLVRIYDYVKYK